MKSRTTLILLFCVCLMGAGIFLVEQDRRHHADTHALKSEVLPFKAENVDFLRLRNEEALFECVKQDGQWFVQLPIKARGNAEVIERTLSQLERLSPLELITVEQREIRGLELKDYGLSEPRAEITVRDALQERTLLVGADAPMGDWVYTKLSRYPEVIALPKGLMDLIPLRLESLRDAHVLPRGAGQTTRIDMHRPSQGFVRLVKENSKWKLMQPMICNADSEVVDALLGTLYSTEAQTFVWDATTPNVPMPAVGQPDFDADRLAELATRVDAYGLAGDEASARIEVWSADGLTSRELTLGKPLEGVDGGEGQVYAIRRDVPSVYGVSSNLLNSLSIDVDQLRSRMLFDMSPHQVDQVAFLKGEQRLVIARDVDGIWQIRQPVQWRADRHAVDAMLKYLSKWQVSGFVKSAETNAAVAAMSNPWGTIELARKRIVSPEVQETDRVPGHAFDVFTRVVIGELSGASDTVYVESLGMAGYATLDPRLLKAMPAESTDPLSYRDRGVVAVLSEDVHRISYTLGSNVQTIVRRDDGGWRPVHGVGLVDTAAVENILFQLSQLRALRIEAMVPESLTRYGLDDSATQLTLGLRGEQGIQKSLLFGFRSGTDGVFSTVQGLDVVFALSHESVAVLTHSLFLPSQPVSASLETSD